MMPPGEGRYSQRSLSRLEQEQTDAVAARATVSVSMRGLGQIGTLLGLVQS